MRLDCKIPSSKRKAGNSWTTNILSSVVFRKPLDKKNLQLPTLA